MEALAVAFAALVLSVVVLCVCFVITANLDDFLEFVALELWDRVKVKKGGE